MTGQAIREALVRANFYSDGDSYVLAQLPAKAIVAAAGVVAEIGEPFCVLIVDKDEVSLLVAAEALEHFGGRLRGHVANQQRYRLITIDAVLEPTLVGFMAYISAALAEAGVPIFPYAAYSRDHVVVPADQFEKAMETLERLKAEAKR